MSALKNIFEICQSAADLELVYTHHSCAINSDRFVYDGLGVRVTYKIYW